MTLRTAVHARKVSLNVVGDGMTTSRVRLLLTNESSLPLNVVIPANEILHSTKATTQDMLVVQDTTVITEPGELSAVDVPTLCISPKSVEPPQGQATPVWPGPHSNEQLWRRFAAIVAASNELESNGTFKTVKLRKNRSSQIAQLTIWKMLAGLSNKPADQVTAATIKRDLIREISIAASQDPEVHAHVIQSGARFEPGGRLVPSPQFSQSIGSVAAAVYGAVGMTMQHSRSANLKGVATLPHTDWDAFYYAGQRALERRDYSSARELIGASADEARRMGSVGTNLKLSLASLDKLPHRIATGPKSQEGVKIKQPDASQMKQPAGEKWGLVVGVSKYKEPGLNLRYASKDAQDFASFLIHECGFKPDHVHVLLDEQATKESILSELGETFLGRVARRDDLVVVYISGQGSPCRSVEGGDNYLLVHDSNKDHLYETAIFAADLPRTVSERVHSMRTALILDVSYSGATECSTTAHRSAGDLLESNVDRQSQLLVCSSSRSQQSWESKHYSNSVFTYRFLEALRGNGANVRDAFLRMHDKVDEEVYSDRGEHQTPVLKSAGRPDAELNLHDGAAR